MSRGLAVAVAFALLLAGCASAPPSPALPAFDAVAAVAAIRAAGEEASEELVIRPLGDSEVTDLREQAARFETSAAYGDAAVALDQALAITPDDPALLQERAEIAVLEHDLGTAVDLAQRAIAAGAQVGPLCRRHWETIVQARIAQARAVLASADATPAPSAAAARQRRDACTVAAPKRF